MIKSDLVSIRSLLPEDTNFILATVLRGLYYGGSIFSEMRKQAFMEKYHEVVKHLLIQNANTTKVACLKEDPSVILGYSLMSNETINFVFVKKSWRGIGIARDLIPSTIKSVSHLTKTGMSIAKKQGWDFNPFLT